jgi:hypothetical protein
LLFPRTPSQEIPGRRHTTFLRGEWGKSQIVKKREGNPAGPSHCRFHHSPAVKRLQGIRFARKTTLWHTMFALRVIPIYETAGPADRAAPSLPPTPPAAPSRTAPPSSCLRYPTENKLPIGAEPRSIPPKKTCLSVKLQPGGVVYFYSATNPRLRAGSWSIFAPPRTNRRAAAKQSASFGALMKAHVAVLFALVGAPASPPAVR